MNRSARRTVAVCLPAAAVLAAAAGLIEPPSHNQIAGKPDLVIQDAARQLKQSTIAGTPDEPHAPGRSIIWCSTLQLAWNELKPVMGEPLRVEGDPPLALRLNNARESRADLDDRSYVALAGFGRDGILARITGQLQDKFNGAASPDLLPSSVPDDSILAYAYLFKNLAFEHPFIRRETPFEFEGAPTRAFGLWPDHAVQGRAEIARQIIIHSYQSPTQWTVELLNQSSGDRLIIARAEPGPTLADTVAAITSTLDAPEKPAFDDRDTLIIPLFNFDITRRYTELTGLDISGSKVTGRIDEAIQNIRFRLDETGAVLKSEAVMGETSAMPVNRARSMVCDGPFAIVMMRDGAAAPYFAAWIENPELLVGWK
ncbi:MAG: hypothetical protein IT436_03595 [Phycisphaerales bacterium]|nr:hypothetical protein [Phycisphaerales bacterium]